MTDLHTAAQAAQPVTPAFDAAIRDYASAVTHGDKDGMRAGYVALRAMCGSQPVAPAGWKLVPVEPTEQMLRACIYNTDYDTEGDWSAAEGNYRAMLSAAPPAPAAQPLAERDVADARRYRWLREREVEIRRYATVGAHASEKLDEQIDAAIGAQP